MSAADYLGMYAEGWTKGDENTLLNSLSDEYVLDDPNAGKIKKDEFSEYLAGMKEAVRSLLNGELPEPFLELTEVVTQENDGEITAWAWWTVPGTDIKGSGLIKVGAEGVRSEVLTYYTKLPG
ncbi:MAG: nuclear transport factor 2 family protein [Gemmatimonadales bacterium]